MFVKSITAALFASASAVNAIKPIETYGNKFFDADGNRFFMKGIAYQLRPQDPLADTEQCKRDAKLMETINTNALRIYHVDPDEDHDGCMNAFADAGIYTLIDLDTFNSYILTEDTYWNKTQFDAYAKVMDAFAKYDNVLGFFVGNEVIATKEQSETAPFIRAAVRDLKAYRDKKGYRKIPVGYSAADIKELRPQLQDYLTCGGDDSTTIDFYGLNSYSWCDPSDFNKSSYNELQEQAKDFPVPIFFTETGCNTPGPRLWEDQNAIFGPEMVDDWSGSLVYEWIQEQNNYGIVSYGPSVAATATGAHIFDGFTREGTPTPISPDFNNLKKVWQTISPSGVKKSDYDPGHVSTRACPTSTAGGWLVDGNVRIPTLGETYSGSYTSQASATGDSSDPQETGDGDDDSAAPGSHQIQGMSTALVGVMLIFTVFF